MRKILLTALLCASALFARADYPYMLFRTADGTEHTIPSAGLSITFADGNLHAVSGEEFLTLPLTDLLSMSFSETGTTGISGIDASEPVTIFTADGLELGSYPSAAEASASLPSGLYIIRNHSGQSCKIRLTK